MPPQLVERSRKISNPIALVRSQGHKACDHARLYAPRLKNLGGLPFHDQVADCRSAQSSAPRWHENTRAQTAFLSARGELIRLPLRVGGDKTARTASARSYEH